MTSEHADILVVDDDRVNRTLLSSSLRREGHSVTCAADGQEALAILEEKPFDVLLVDVVMPGMDGYALLGRLKGDARWAHVPVIMISAVDELDSVVRCVELGAEDYLGKPIEPLLLRARIRAATARKRLADLEREYLEQVGHVVAAAGALEEGSFAPRALDPVAARDDALGQLARVFQRMAAEVEAREQKLELEVRQLRIEIDEGRAARQVAEITESEYFQELERKVQRLRGAVQ